ncbi:hypothetical protein [Streptomyces sp. KR80]|uniref:hypothetical protein n=1 Tax=Streptomyces sp. KR80 TaxID=3457426 RepID=UPI003FD3AA0C
MGLRFVGIDPDTDRDHCPTVWVDEGAGELVFQGWKADAQLQAACQSTSPANGPIPSHEAVVRLPVRMVPLIREACDAVERSELR